MNSRDRWKQLYEEIKPAQRRQGRICDWPVAVTAISLMLTALLEWLKWLR